MKWQQVNIRFPDNEYNKLQAEWKKVCKENLECISFNSYLRSLIAKANGQEK